MMKRVFIELIALLAIGGLLWAAFAFFVKLPERPTLISQEKEQALGENYTNFILTLNGFEKVEHPVLDEVFSLTAQKLKDVQDETVYSYNITIVDNEMVNAFALPGGYIIVTTGLINFCETSEELISVICHEIGHIEKRHVITRLIKDVGLEILTSGDTFVTGEIARGLISSGYNRKQEEEADFFACELMLKSGLEPRSIASFFRRLKDEENELIGQFEIISSHPNLNNRIKTVLSFEVPEGFVQQEPWVNIEELKSILSDDPLI